MSIDAGRKDWQEEAIDPDALEADPIVEFQKWYELAKGSDDLLPEAMSLATVAEDGRATVRTVLMRGCDERGISFFTSYDSPKADDMSVNPRVALAFHWKLLYRQVRIEGTATRLAEEESKEYWDTRPRGSRLAAWASTQSAEVDRWETLADRVEHLEANCPDEDIPLPYFWGGYVVEPNRFEFWLSRPSRLHDRFLYVKNDSGWAISRLQP